MPNTTKYLGDGGGQGHELKVMHQDYGTVVLLSHNPDTDELQRVVLLECQWRLMLRFLLEVYGKDKCCYFQTDGTCGGASLEFET